MRNSLIILLTLFISSVSAQKVYLTREGVQRLTKQLNNCAVAQRELIKTKLEISELKRNINKQDSIFEITRIKLDSIIAIAEQDYQELERKYNKVLKLIPKRKRKNL